MMYVETYHICIVLLLNLILLVYCRGLADALSHRLPFPLGPGHVILGRKWTRGVAVRRGSSTRSPSLLGEICDSL